MLQRFDLSYVHYAKIGDLATLGPDRRTLEIGKEFDMGTSSLVKHGL
jgi:hypothetical protein